MGTARDARMMDAVRRTAGTWPIGGDCAHAVQFYEDDAVLIELLAAFVGTALVTGQSAMVVATAAHRMALAGELKSRGLDVAVPRLQGRFLAMDAGAILQRIVSGDGDPDERVFRDVVGGALGWLRQAAADQRARVHVFGEMVALEWAAGRPESAIRLEECWNRLIDEQAVSLCCAYPMSAFHARDHAASFMRICAQHSHVFPAERPV